MPPIVGVPCLAMWCSGRGPPCRGSAGRGRGCGTAVIRARVTNSDSTPATTPAIMTAITGIGHRWSRATLDGRRPAVVERQHRSPIVWVVSWPLPATTTTSPGAASPIASRDRRRPIGLDRRRGRGRRGTPPSTSSMMAAGSSERGLSDVTTTRSARRRRHGAHPRPLRRGRGRRRQPNTTMHPAARRRPAAAAMTSLEAVGRVGVVDDHDDRRRRRRRRDPLEAAGHRPPRRARRRSRRRRCRAPRPSSPRRAS